jgi:hypothetical protein
MGKLYYINLIQNKKLLIRFRNRFHFIVIINVKNLKVVNIFSQKLSNNHLVVK